ncbi:MAG: threonylcarbamoyl-AMP synthase [Alistipes sp.]|nr:threonylcarbamoyl-AMP synthase [Alistipes sp.]
MLVKIYTRNPSEKEIDRAVAVLERDGIVVYPTDSVYAFGCSVRSVRAAERLRRIKGKDHTTFSVVFDSLAQVADYCRVDNAQFRVLRRNLPGPFTFLLETSSRMPDKALGNRRTIGCRIPDNPIPRALVERLGCPMLTASVPDDDESEYMTDPELIHERYGRETELVIDGGAGRTMPTTVVDLTCDEPEVLRQGLGTLE